MPQPFRSLRPSTALGLISMASLLILAGCHKNDEAPAGPSAPANGILASGPRLIQTNGCTRCHTLNGQGGHMGPNLSHVGSDPQHTATWLAAYIKNPHQVNPNSRMPAFGSRISDSDLNIIGTYLAGLK